MSSEFTIDSSLRSVRYLELYVEIVTLFADNLSQAALQSEGMKNFQKEINGIAQSSEFQTLSSELSKMETNFGYLKSVTLGINLDGNLCPMEPDILQPKCSPASALSAAVGFMSHTSTI